MNNEIASLIAQKLLQIKAIKLSPQNPFTWASGLKSPIYCDNRLSLSHPSIRNFICKDGMAKLSKDFDEFDTVAGVATSGIAFGAILADFLGLPFVYVRSSAKAHGRQNRIEGELKEEAKVLVVEDLISTGGSCLEAVEALRIQNAKVVGVAAIFSYGLEVSYNAFKEANLTYLTLSNFEVLIQEAEKLNYIDQRDHELLMQWREDPKKWSFISSQETV